MRTVDAPLGESIECPSERAADRRTRSKKLPSWAVVVMALAVSVFPVARAGERRDDKARPVGEVLPDKALVYLVRPDAYVGSFLTAFVYSDQVFLGTLDDSSYAFAHVEPGEHLVWLKIQALSAQERFEFIAGQTYHLKLSPDAITLVSEEEGLAAIKKARSYKTTTAKEIEASKRHIEKKWAEIQTRDSAEPRAAVDKMVAEPAPVDVTGKVRIPKGTTVKLELLENVSSALSQPGDTVRFRVVDDLVIDGSAVVRAGTAVQAKLNQVKGAAGSGKPGVIDIVFPGLRAADGSPVPVVGRKMGTGKDRNGSVTGSTAAFGLIGALIGSTIKGGEVLIQVGEIYEVMTPVDVWVDPNRATPPALDTANAELPGLALASTARNVECDLKTACRTLDDIVVQLQSEQPPSEVALRAIDGRELPAPIAASALRPGKNGSWTCRFPGWSLVRNLPLNAGTATVALQIAGSLEDGTAFKSDTAVAVVVRQ